MVSKLPKGKIGKSFIELFASKETTHDRYISEAILVFCFCSQNIEGVITVSVHTAAAEGDLGVLKAIEKENSDSLFTADGNGWTALQ